METEATFVQQLKAARKAAGLTQAGLAEALEIHRRTVEDWERGINAPPKWSQRLLLEELARMAKN